MGTAMNVVGNYKYSLDLTRTITLLGLITWCILLFRVKRLRLPKGKKRISAILGSAAICFASFWIMQKRMRPDFYAKYPVDDNS